MKLPMLQGARARILVVDDDESMCAFLEEGLGRREIDLDWRTTPEDALAYLETHDVEAVVTDLRLGKVTGLQLCERILERHSEMPVIVLTAFGTMETAIAAIRVGAYDFVTKPVDLDDLGRRIGRAVQMRRLDREVKQLREQVDAAKRPSDLIGESPAMSKLFEMLRAVRQTDATVLITGESGTGKELVARSIHAHSECADGPFVAINCAAMPEHLLESELFGHTRGAFTDARRAREGLFVHASGGTLLLDEVGELPLSMQPKLLRALQERRVRPVGGTEEVPFDCRILAATNRDLESEVEDGNFREDLFYRINVIQLAVPALRSRGHDILLLAQEFIRRISERTGKGVVGISRPAAQKLLDYDWPGNVRELENCIERAVALTTYEEIQVDDFPDTIRSYQSQRLVVGGTDPDEFLSLEALERRYIARVLSATGGNKTQAAKILGVDRRTLYRKLDRYEENAE